MRLPLLAAAALVAVLVLSGCDGSQGRDADRHGTDPATPAEPADPATTQVQVHYRDSSVPPEYHRSWDLTIDAQHTELAVDSYGEPIAEAKARTPTAEWKAFVADLHSDLTDLGEPSEPDPGCDGGNGLEVVVTGDAETSLDIDNCNTEDNEAMMAKIEELIEPFTDAVRLEKHTRT